MTFRRLGSIKSHFTWADIESGYISVEHDAFEGAPYAEVKLDNGQTSSANEVIHFNFSSTNDAPEVQHTRQLVLEQHGPSVTLSANEWEIMDPDHLLESMTFVMQDNRAVELSVDGSPSSTFSYTDLQSGLVSIQSVGDDNILPSISFHVSDGVDSSPPVFMNLRLSCVAGRYNHTTADESGLICFECPQGRFGPSSGATSVNACLPCDKGHHMPLAGSAGPCFACREGRYSNDTATVTCSLCPAGRYLPHNGSQSFNECEMCPVGHYNEDEGSPSISSCSRCPPGTANPNSGSSSLVECRSCEAGKYSEEHGSNTCDPCSVGSSSSAIGATSSLTCVACSPGTYADATGMIVCSNCPTGTYSNETASTTLDACLPCAAGSFNDIEAQTSCQQCGMGRYVGSTGSKSASDCIACMEGTYLNSTGGTSSSDCLLCAPGRFADSLNMSECELCPQGRYGPGEGGDTIDACLSCGWYFECPTEGMTIGEPCPESSRANDDMTSCSVPCARCIGGGENGGGCLGGFTSRDCLECPDGYYDTKDECVKCKELWETLLTISLVLGLLIFFYYVTRNNLFDRAVFIMVLSFLVLCIIMFVMMSFDKPKILSDFLTYLSVLGFYFDAGSPGCFGTWNQYHRFSLFVGVLFLAILFIWWYETKYLPKWTRVIEAGVKETNRHMAASRSSRDNMMISGLGDAENRISAIKASSEDLTFEAPRDWDKAYSTALKLDHKRQFRSQRDLVLLMVFPTILGYCVSVMSCYANALISDPSLECDGALFHSMRVLGGILFVLVGICVPLYVANMIYRLRDRNWKQEELKKQEQEHEQEQEQEEANSVRQSMWRSPSRMFFIVMEWLSRRRSNDIRRMSTMRRDIHTERVPKRAVPALDLVQEFKRPYFVVVSLLRKSLMVVCLLASRDVNIQLVLLLSINAVYLFALIIMKPYVYVTLSDKPTRLDPLNHLEMMLTLVLILILALFLISFNFSLISTSAASLTSIVIMFLVPLTGVSILVAKSQAQRSRDEGDGEGYAESKLDMFRCLQCGESFEDVEVVDENPLYKKPIEAEVQELMKGEQQTMESEEKEEEECKATERKRQERKPGDDHVKYLFVGFHASSSQDDMAVEVQERLECQKLLHRILINDINHVVSLVKPYLVDYKATHTNSFIPSAPPVSPLKPMNHTEYLRIAFGWSKWMFNSLHMPPDGNESSPGEGRSMADAVMKPQKGLCDWCTLHKRERRFKNMWVSWLREWRKREAVCGTTPLVGDVLYNCLVSVPDADRVVATLLEKVLLLRFEVLGSVRRFAFILKRQNTMYREEKAEELRHLEQLLSRWVDIRHIVFSGTPLPHIVWSKEENDKNGSVTSPSAIEMDDLSAVNM